QERPLTTRDHAPLTQHRATYRQFVFSAVRLYRRLSFLSPMAEGGVKDFRCKNKIRPHPAGDRLAVVGRHRRVKPQHSLAIRHIELPAQPDERETAAHQKPIALSAASRAATDSRSAPHRILASVTLPDSSITTLMKTDPDMRSALAEAG